jgi:hypothetical protein
LALTPSKKVLCTKRQLSECLVALAHEAYALGFLSDQTEQFESLVATGAAERPAWMDLPLDAPETFVKHGLRLRPVVVRSLADAGDRTLGDLCWVSEYELRKLFYLGRITAREIRTVIRNLQARTPVLHRGGNGGDGESAA